jgi:predicted TIM-barrel fold metal-dependent hydrolase
MNDAVHEDLYSGPIIDAHHHLWDLSLGYHPWLNGGGEALPGLEKVASNYLISDYLDDVDGHDVVASVYVEALWEGEPADEIHWVDNLRSPGRIAGKYVAAGRLGTPAAENLIRLYGAHQAVVGVRSILSWHPEVSKGFVRDPMLSYRPEWRKDVALLVQRNLHLELMVYPYQAQAVVDLARSHPDLRIVINHCGSPIDRDEAGMAMWEDGLKLMGCLPNVWIKLSNASIYDRDWTFESLAKVANICLASFGAEKVMFGTDNPVAKINMPAKLIIRGAKEIMRGRSPADQQAFFHDNAFRFYGFG